MAACIVAWGIFLLGIMSPFRFDVFLIEQNIADKTDASCIFDLCVDTERLYLSTNHSRADTLDARQESLPKIVAKPGLGSQNCLMMSNVFDKLSFGSRSWAWSFRHSEWPWVENSVLYQTYIISRTNRPWKGMILI